MAMIVDSQLHVWRDILPGKTAHFDGSFDPPVVLPLMADAGVSAAVAIPTRWDPRGNGTVVEAARTYPDRFAAMGMLDSLVDLPQRFARWREEGLRGVWVTFLHDPAAAWLASGEIEALWDAAEQANVPVMALAPGERLSALGDAARRHPGLSLAACHLALHQGITSAELDEQVHRLIGLAEFSNLSVKVSSLPLFSREQFPYRDMFDPVRNVIAAFGPDRCFFGTNISRQPCSYPQAIEMMQMIIGDLDPSEQDLIMGSALLRWLDWASIDAPSWSDPTRT